METKEESNSYPYLRATSRYGLYLGLILIGIQTIQYIAGLYESTVINGLSMSLFIAANVLIIRDFRDNSLNGWLKYGEGVKIGLMSSLAAGILTGAFMLLLILVIDKSIIDEILIQMEEEMIESGAKEEEIELSLNFMGSNIWLFGLGPILQFGSIGLITSLIASIFLRKNPDNSFDKDTQ